MVQSAEYVRLIPFEWDPSVTRPCSVAFGRVCRVQQMRNNAFTHHGISRPNSAVYGRRFTRTNTVPVDDRAYPQDGLKTGNYRNTADSAQRSVRNDQQNCAGQEVEAPGFTSEFTTLAFAKNDKDKKYSPILCYCCAVIHFHE
jgi:hypothetical protein